MGFARKQEMTEFFNFEWHERHGFEQSWCAAASTRQILVSVSREEHGAIQRTRGTSTEAVGSFAIDWRRRDKWEAYTKAKRVFFHTDTAEARGR